MANFKQYTPRQATAGPARLGKADWSGDPPAPAADPGDMADVMLASTFAFVSPHEEMGGTSGGVTITKGFEATGYRLDQSDTDAFEEVTGNTMTVATSLGQTGDLEKFSDAWGADPTTTAIVGPPAGRKKGLAAEQTVPHLTVSVMEADRAGKLRSFWLREVARAAGDSAYALAPGALHLLPITWKAYGDPTKTKNEFGWIIEDVGFGGIT